MKYELVDILTKDQLVHQGMVHIPKGCGKTAVVWIHGLTGTFYSNTKSMELFALACEKQKMAFGAFNTRGHDYVSDAHKIDGTNTRGYVHQTIGAGVEHFPDCVQDIDAMVSFFVHRGFEKMVLVGHSTGANKVCYYAGTVNDPKVAGVVLSGPMSDRYSASDEQTNKKHHAIMEQKIREGKGEELLTGFDFFPLTPKRWMSLLAVGSPEDVFNYHDEEGALATFSKITIPLLVMFGGSDEHADRPIVEIQKAFDAHAQSAKYKSVVIPGADHSFTGKEHTFVDVIVSWAASLQREARK